MAFLVGGNRFLLRFTGGHKQFRRSALLKARRRTMSPFCVHRTGCRSSGAGGRGSCASRAPWPRWSRRNSDPLSTWAWSIGKGYSAWITSNTKTIHLAALFFTDRFTDQTVKVSVTARVKTCSPVGGESAVGDGVAGHQPGLPVDHRDPCHDRDRLPVLVLRRVGGGDPVRLQLCLVGP